MADQPGSKTTSDWDAYWENAKSASVCKDGGPQDKMLDRFWSRFFEQAFPAFQAQVNMLDVACGNGAVSRLALASKRYLNRGTDLQITGLDASTAALKEVGNRYPDLICIAANAATTPFKDGAFDLVTSQFGMEYAGPDAVTDAIRVIRPNGMIALVLHMHEGGIYRECAINLDAIETFRNSELLTCFAGIFEAAQAVQQGREDRESFQEADRKFAGSVTAAEGVFRQWGKEVTDGMLFRVYKDIAEMYRRFKVYDPNEVFEWIDLMQNELDTYAGRMASMLEAALNRPALDKLLDKLKHNGLTIHSHDSLYMGQQTIPAAWTVVAEKYSC